ncbi:hypothetical protein J4Q44_G00327830 [Coregonus suidteri]|uniref:Uncharacterized protein n=1 Tax=Coregonus suidteri TaxID=861788 RepID=A0AAN8KXI4_9TELE
MMETAHRPAHLMGLTDRMWTPMTPSVVLVLRAYYLALLASLEFLSMCVSAEFIHGLFFKPAEVRRKLLLLLEDMDCTKPLHLNMYLVLLKKLPAEDTSLAAEEFDSLLRPLPDLCSLYRQDQEICAAVLLGLLPSIRSLGRTQDQHNDMRHVQGALLQVVSGFCILGRTGKCTAIVKVALIHCLLALLEADPCCKWAVLTLREEELPVSVILPSHLSDSHRHVRMLAAMTVERLFLQITPDSLEKRKMLPLKCQQTAFENVYLKAQEGMSIQKSSSPEDPCDETFNRKATLLKNVSVVLCCSPVCEKQSLFTLFQSYKENNIEEPLIKKKLIITDCRLNEQDAVYSRTNRELDPAPNPTLLQLLCHQSHTGLPQQMSQCQSQVPGGHFIQDSDLHPEDPAGGVSESS